MLARAHVHVGYEGREGATGWEERKGARMRSEYQLYPGVEKV